MAQGNTFQSLLFDGNDETLQETTLTGNNIKLGAAEKYYLIGWINNNLALTSQFIHGLAKNAASANKGDTYLKLNADGLAQFITERTSGFQTITGTTVIGGNNEWTCVLGVHDGVNLHLFVDSVEEATKTHNENGSFQTSKYQVNAGALIFSGINIPYSGHMTQIAWVNGWSDATAQDLADRLYNGGVPLDLTGENEFNYWYELPSVNPSISTGDFGDNTDGSSMPDMTAFNFENGDAVNEYPAAPSSSNGSFSTNLVNGVWRKAGHMHVGLGVR